MRYLIVATFLLDPLDRAYFGPFTQRDVAERRAATWQRKADAAGVDVGYSIVDVWPATATARDRWAHG